jgi:hypothetical protein
LSLQLLCLLAGIDDTLARSAADVVAFATNCCGNTNDGAAIARPSHFVRCSISKIIDTEPMMTPSVPSAAKAMTAQICPFHVNISPPN